jgi:hypothetical protein
MKTIVDAKTMGEAIRQQGRRLKVTRKDPPTPDGQANDSHP